MRIRPAVPCLLLGLVLLPATPARAAFLYGVFSRDGVDVIAVGDSGMVYRSVDGGSYYARTYPVSTRLRAVAARDLTILIVGDGGTILRSTDNGGSWATTIAGGSPGLLDVEFPGPDTAFAAGTGGAILRSVDGGLSWTPLASGTSNSIRRLRFVDASHGWLVGDGGFAARTSDAGETWTPGGPPTSNTLYGVDQLGSRIWAVGAGGTCWRSTDDGGSWNALDLKMEFRADVSAVTLQSADTVYITGGGGFIR